PPSATLFPYTTLFRSMSAVLCRAFSEPLDQRFLYLIARLAVSALAALVIEEGKQRLAASKIRPEDRREVHFGIGQLPEQKIADRSEEHTSELQSRFDI